jgi:hypothetical protein
LVQGHNRLLLAETQPPVGGAARHYRRVSAWQGLTSEDRENAKERKREKDGGKTSGEKSEGKRPFSFDFSSPLSCFHSFVLS